MKKWISWICAIAAFFALVGAVLVVLKKFGPFKTCQVECASPQEEELQS